MSDAMLRQRIKDAIATELFDPYIYVEVQEVLPLDVGVEGVYIVRAITMHQVICDCLVTDFHDRIVVFFSAGFIREAIIKPELARYGIDHPWLMGM